MKSTVTLQRTIAVVAMVTAAAFAATAVCAADGDKTYSKEEFKSDAKSAGQGIKKAAKDVGHQVGDGTKKAYRSAKDKIKKDKQDGKPGDGSLAKKNDSLPVAAPGHN